MVDALDQVYRTVLAQAGAYGFEASLVGTRKVNAIDGEVDDGRLLKLWPKDARPDVLLELELSDNAVRIYRHRTSELTVAFKGRIVSGAWVIKFMQSNAAFAHARTMKAEADKRALAVEIEDRLMNPNPVQFRSKCRACEGEGSWAEGSARDGDNHMVYCPVCHGAGSVSA